MFVVARSALEEYGFLKETVETLNIGLISFLLMPSLTARDQRFQCSARSMLHLLYDIPPLCCEQTKIHNSQGEGMKVCLRFPSRAEEHRKK